MCACACVRSSAGSTHLPTVEDEAGDELAEAGHVEDVDGLEGDDAASGGGVVGRVSVWWW